MPIQKLKTKQNPKVRNATPLKIDGIQFKSKLETHCYNRLKENGFNFKYEEERFVLMPKFEFDGTSTEMIRSRGEKYYKECSPNIRAITYTPDFTNLEDGWVIECKGNPNDAFPLRWKLFKKYIKDNDLKYDLYLPRNKKQIDKTIELLISNRNDKSI